MITIQNFKQAHATLPFRLLQLQAFTLLSVSDDHPFQDLTYTLQVTPAMTDWLLAHSDFEYVDVFGGNVYVCESDADLKHIKDYDPAWPGGWPNNDKILNDSFHVLTYLY